MLLVQGPWEIVDVCCLIKREDARMGVGMALVGLYARIDYCAI